jgi:hypothetical protein
MEQVRVPAQQPAVFQDIQVMADVSGLAPDVVSDRSPCLMAFGDRSECGMVQRDDPDSGLLLKQVAGLTK